MKSIFSYTRMIAFGFLAVILMGTLLLSLPIAARSGDRTALIDCFFTATSATCVTGLTVLDTYMHWSCYYSWTYSNRRTWIYDNNHNVFYFYQKAHQPLRKTSFNAVSRYDKIKRNYNNDKKSCYRYILC